MKGIRAQHFFLLLIQEHSLVRIMDVGMMVGGTGTETQTVASVALGMGVGEGYGVEPTGEGMVG